MRIAIVGAGFTGLSAALRLGQLGHNVEVFDRENMPGGLAVGFRDELWEWPLERHYHHIFTSDTAIQQLAKEVGCKCFFTRPKTSVLYREKVYQFDSPVNLLTFPGLSLFSKFRTGLEMAYLKLINGWSMLEGKTAAGWLEGWDNESYKVLWKPLLAGKFGKYASEVNAAWFWARIKKRSASLGYFEGGFTGLAVMVEEKCKREGVRFNYNSEIETIDSSSSFRLRLKGENGFHIFDRVIVTGPSWLLGKLVPKLPETYRNKLNSYKGIGAVNLVLALKEQFLTDGTYWLNINEADYPFLSLVEHTNMIDNRHYGRDRILYVGNYLSADHQFFRLNEQELITKFEPFLRRVNPKFDKSWVRKAWVFKAPFAQPVVGVDYSKQILPFETPFRGLYWVGMQQVYPWDRGTNYAVQMGWDVAEKINHD